MRLPLHMHVLQTVAAGAFAPHFSLFRWSADAAEVGAGMFDSAVEAILLHHERSTGNRCMRVAAEHAAALGFRLIPVSTGMYLRLVLPARDGSTLMLYLHGAQLAAGAKPLQPVAASRPGEVVTARDVQLPLGATEIAVFGAFAPVGGSASRQRSHASSSGSKRSTPEAPPPRRAAVLPTLPPRQASRGPAAPSQRSLPDRTRPASPAHHPLRRHVPAATNEATGYPYARDQKHKRRGRLSAGVLIGIAALLGALVLGEGLSQTVTTLTQGSAPGIVEAEIAAAERRLAAAEAREAPLPVDALVADPAAGILADPDAASVIAGAEPQTALAAVAALEVKGRAPSTGYDRRLFGSGWGDTDRNGCDTRNDMLARDLADETFKPSTRDCVVVAGTLADPYSGQAIAFRRGESTSDDVQIDHVVAVFDAWQKGAQSWDSSQRIAFYNDPLNLLAVDGLLNRQKGDGDAATWLPPNKGFRCAYVARQIAVKTTYGLWVTQAERNAMASVLSRCPDQVLPVAGATEPSS